MATTITALKINEISLVDRPANQKAKVLLTKRATAKGDPTSTDAHIPGPFGCRKCSTPVGKSDLYCKGCGVPFYMLMDDEEEDDGDELEASASGKKGNARKRATWKMRELLKQSPDAGRIAKGYMDGQAKTLGTAIEEREERELLDALWAALYSIFNDDTISEANEASMVKASFDEFLSRLQGQPAPQADKEASMQVDLTKVAPEVKAHIEKLESENAELKKAATPAPKPEDLVKAAPPEVRERLEKAEREAADTKARLEKIEDERATEQFVKRAETLPHIGGKDRAGLGTLLKRASQKLEKADFETLETLLKAANEQIAKGALFSEAGVTGSGVDAPDSAIGEATAKAIEMLGKGLVKTKEQGIAKVFQEDKALYARHRNEQRKGAN